MVELLLGKGAEVDAQGGDLSISHVSTEVLVAIVRRPMLSTLNTHRCIVLEVVASYRYCLRTLNCVRLELPT